MTDRITLRCRGDDVTVGTQIYYHKDNRDCPMIAKVIQWTADKCGWHLKVESLEGDFYPSIRCDRYRDDVEHRYEMLISEGVDEELARAAVDYYRDTWDYAD